MVKTDKNGSRKKVQTALSIIIAFSLSSLYPCLGKDTGCANKLIRMEGILFGKASPNKSLEDRISAIEKNLFGKTKTGSINTRLAKIEQVLGKNSESKPEPAVAPERHLQKLAKEESSLPVQQGHIEVSHELSTKINDLLSQGLNDFSKGNLNGAEAHFHEVLQHDRNNPDAFFNLGVTAEKKGDLLQSLYYYQVAQKLHPQDKDVQEALLSVENKLCARELVHSSLQRAQPVRAGVTAESYPVVGITPTEIPQQAAQPSRGRGLAATLARAALIMGVQAAPLPGGVSCPLCRIMRSGL